MIEEEQLMRPENLPPKNWTILQLRSYRKAVLPESGRLAPRELEPAAVRDKCSPGPTLGRGDVR